MTPQLAAAPSVPWHALPAAEALAGLGASADGLAGAEAARRLAADGPNRLLAVAPRSAWSILVAQLRSLVVGLLAAVAALALLTGDVLECVTVVAVLLVDVGVGFTTEWRGRRAMEALRRLQPQLARVRRDGAAVILDAADVVAGDVLLLEEGDNVPADARLLAASELRAVEAPLTGEPYPVEKGLAAVDAAAPLAERTDMLFKGTVVAAGQGEAVVTATGAHTEVGRIGALVRDTEEPVTPLERRLERLGRQVLWVTVALAALVTGAGLLRGGAPWLMVQAGIALTVAAVPEGLPAVATIALAVGLRRMARRHAVVRRLGAVETLGEVTVLCTDKTGTLTSGEVRLTAAWLAAGELAVDEAGGFTFGEAPVRAEALPGLLALLETAALCNHATLADAATGHGAHGDPTEVALLLAAQAAGRPRAALLAAAPEIAVVPFRSERQLMATFHATPAGRLVCVKGAAQRLLPLCATLAGGAVVGGAASLDEAARGLVVAAEQRLASRGLRVLAVARRSLATGEATGEGALDALELLGLVALADPPAPDVPGVLATLRTAGIRTVMITGDQTATARSIAGALGMLGAADEVLDGRELAQLSDADLGRRLPRVAALSRVDPAQKSRIVEALRRGGEVVAMLGDGVNDAPALRRADVGIALGRRGTDVAKETADVVLADDRLANVAAAVAEGRVIHDNLGKVMRYLFACNAAEVAVVWLALVVGLPLPLLPLQVLWLNLLTDVLPALALAVDPPADGVMARRPRRPDAPLLARGELRLVAAHAVLLTASALGVFVAAARLVDLPRARTATFVTLALAQLVLALDSRAEAARTRRRDLFRNGWLWGAIAAGLLLQLAVVYLPPLARAFGTVALSARELAVVVAAAVVPLLAGRALQALRRFSRRTGAPLEEGSS